MELICKVTSKCDMACTFCSASKLGLDDMTPEEIAEAAKKTGAQTLIILGGEALCMGPEYYHKLLKLTDARLDFTTNLKDFYLHPEKWIPLFRNPRVGVCTSFNYGSSRLFDKKTVYTEEMFKETIELFKKEIGYAPPFIAVMDENNIDTWRKHIELAKELGTKCRLNNALKIGRQGKYFPRAEMFKVWVQIVKEGLADYETNASERAIGRCPMNTCGVCKSTIRVVQKKNGKLIFHDCDDRSNGGCAPIPEDRIHEKPIVRRSGQPLKYECYQCQLFNVCNGCDTNQAQIEDVDKYCVTMKSLEKDIVNLGWRLE